MLATTAVSVLLLRRRPPAPPFGRLLSSGAGGRSRLPLGEAEDPFKVIGVGVEADEKEIKARFYAKAKVLHPDVAGRDTKVRPSAAKADSLASNQPIPAPSLLLTPPEPHLHVSTR
jgi:hypothetical protein